MTRTAPPRRRRIAEQNGALMAAAILAGITYGALYELITTSMPLVFPRWLFFILLYCAASATALPFAWLINRRLARQTVAGGVLVRESMLVGLWVVTAAWLQMTRTFTAVTGILLALSLIVIEAFLRLREHPLD